MEHLPRGYPSTCCSRRPGRYLICAFCLHAFSMICCYCWRFCAEFCCLCCRCGRFHWRRRRYDGWPHWPRPGCYASSKTTCWSLRSSVNELLKRCGPPSMLATARRSCEDFYCRSLQPVSSTWGARDSHRQSFGWPGETGAPLLSRRTAGGTWIGWAGLWWR